jgi:transposase
VAALIGRPLHVRYTVRGATYLMRRLGYTPQVPAHRAAERDEQQIALWKETTWSEIKG